uniref:protein-serine/threonine phosphatase n=1 Tax=Anas zonorhyncha TaxID=75864 RepID=A0A8B9VK72_9AVES
MVKGAALLLPAEEPLVAEPPPAAPPGRQEQHLQLMMQLLRPQDAIRLAVRLESARPQRVRYLLVVRPEEADAEGQTVLLGVDFPHEGSTRCTLGMVLPLWSDTQVFLDGDGGFSVMSGGQTRIFKPISVQTMWAVLQELHRACEQAARGGHIPGGPALLWARDYAAALSSEQSCLNEWLAMADLESVRPGSPQPSGPAVPELTEQAVRALLRDVLASADLESVTSKEVGAVGRGWAGEWGGGVPSASLTPAVPGADGAGVAHGAQPGPAQGLHRQRDAAGAGADGPALLRLPAPLPGLRVERCQPGGAAAEPVGEGLSATGRAGGQRGARPPSSAPALCSITHILNVAREIDNFFPALFTYMNVRVYDEEAAELLPHWNDTFLFLSDVKARGGRALVHCRMGLSRSAATVLAYAMKEFGWPLERALRHVRCCRPGVMPNPGFMRQLDFYQGILSASRHSVLWEPRAAERVSQPEPEEAAPGDEGVLPQPRAPSPSPQPPEEASRQPAGPGLSGAPQRPRISLCAVMRSISLMESPQPPELLGEPLDGAVFEATEVPGDPGDPGGSPSGARPSSRPRRVVRQASVDGGPGCAEAPSPPASGCDPALAPTSPLAP